MTDLLDSQKGRAVSETRRTICEAVRELYDKCVMELADTDPAKLARLKPHVEEIFRLGIRMNRRLLELNIKAIDYYDEDIVDVEAMKAQRQHRQALVKQMEDLEEHYAKGLDGR